MKTKIYLLALLLSPFVYMQCGSAKKLPVICDENITLAVRNIYDYSFDSLPYHLDSALIYLDEISGKCDLYHENLISLHKVNIFYIKRDMRAAITILDTLDVGVFMFPEFRDILINTFRGKEAEYKGNIQQRNIYYKNIVNYYEVYVVRNKEQFDSIMRLPDVASIREGVGFYMNEMYYYKAKIEGMDKVILEIDSLQKAVNGNEEYFEEFKKYLRNEEGYSMRVMFE